MKPLISAFALSLVAPLAAQAAPCAPFGPDPLAGFSPMDATLYLDLPNPDTMTAAHGLELSLVDQLHAGQFPTLSKTYCQVGIQQAIIDFSYPVEDDAVAQWVTRAVFVWDATEETAGWRLDQLGERGLCARGDDPFAALCP